MEPPRGSLSSVLRVTWDKPELAFPEEYSISSRAAPADVLPDPRRIVVLDQGDEPDAAPYAVAAALNYMRRRGPVDRVSVSFLAAAAREIRPSTVDIPDVTSVLLLLRAQGALGEEVWPPDKADAPPELMAAGADLDPRFMIETASRIAPKRELLMAALQEAGAIVLEGDFSADVLSGAPPTSAQGSPQGRHAVTLVGAKAESALVQNSWGPAWGGAELAGARAGGLAWIPWELLERHATRGWLLRLPESESAHDAPRPRAGFRSDGVGDRDRLGVEREVEALAMVISSREVRPPLSVGLFGNWGGGKSFFMDRLRVAVQRLTDSAGEAEARLRNGESADLPEPAFWSSVAQIEFNAWHFVDSNLWASLVVRIFDGLARHLAPDDAKSTVEDQRQELFTRIEEKNREITELEVKKQGADQEVIQAEQRLSASERSVESAAEELEALDLPGIALRLWNKRLESDPAFRQAVEALGLPRHAASFHELAAGVEGVRDAGGRLAKRWHAITAGGDPRLRVATVVGLAIAALFVWKLSESAEVGGLLKALASASTLVGGLLASGLAWTRKVNEHLAAVESVLGPVEKAKEMSPQQKQEREAAAQALAQRRTERETVRSDLEQRLAERAELEAKLAELRIGRRLYRFIREKAGAAGYREKLGIISAIRTDFDALSDLIDEHARAKRAAWADREKAAQVGQDRAGLADLDRIVLYIDDLDRCPPERVVEVLQAVHLLLAFPLFVVVVAVDSRWLLRSLEDEFPAFQELDRQVHNAAEGKRASTPQNYLEKIFQIALTIKPMDKAGYEALVDDLVPLRVAEGFEPDLGNTQGLVGRPAHLPRGDKIHALKPFVEANPPGLDMPVGEIALMKGLFGFLETPRTVKRFVNMYRLLRASLDAQELEDFERPGASHPKAALVLLAILTGFPELAERVFQALHGADPQEAWPLFLDRLQVVRVVAKEPEGFLNIKGLPPSGDAPPGAWPGPRNPDEFRVLHYKNELDAHIDEREWGAWARLRSLLESHAFGSLAELQAWLPRIARYSMRTLRLETEVQPL